MHGNDVIYTFVHGNISILSIYALAVRGNISRCDVFLIIGMPERFRCLNVDLSGVSVVSYSDSSPVSLSLLRKSQTLRSVFFDFYFEYSEMIGLLRQHRAPRSL